MVTLDSACRKCGYNLRGLQTDGLCPECGMAVALSVRGDLLRFSDPNWLLKLARGMLIRLVGVYGTLALWLLWVAVATSQRRSLRGFTLYGSFLTGALNLIGTWLITVPDPSGVGEDKYGTLRKIVRVTLAIELGDSVLWRMPQLAILSRPLYRLAAVTLDVCGMAQIVAVWAQLRYLGALAERLPDEKIISTAKILRTWLTVSFGLVYLLINGIQLFRVFAKTSLTRPAALSVGCSILLVGPVLLIMEILFLIMLHKFRRQILRQATTADAIWAATPAQNPT